MPNAIAGRYRARDGREHRVVVCRVAPGGWRVLDVAQTAAVVDTLTDAEDRLAQALALARDYAAEQQAFQFELREDPLPHPHTSGAAATLARAA